MKTYECVLESSPDFCWSVYETATEQTVQRYVFEEDAVKHVKFLRNGGGFAGHTPAFLFNNDRGEIKTNLMVNLFLSSRPRA